MDISYYLIVIEKSENNYGAYFPDFPGCITVGDTIEELKKNALEALELHLQDEVVIPFPPPIKEQTLKDIELTGNELIAWIEYKHGVH